jgi:S1-C subfamily serine protease
VTSRGRIVTSATALVGAGLAGAALALAGAAVLFGGNGDTTTVREVVTPGNSAVGFSSDQRQGLTINDIFRRSAPGVVQITTTRSVSTPVDPFLNPFGFQQKQTERALGSGFVWDKNGHIVTNYHVVAGARTALVSFSNNESVRARVIGTDPSTDVAVLRANLKSRALTPLMRGDSDHVQVGDAVVAIGNPFGLDRTVTAGIVSALQRPITAPNGYTIDHVIQTDAALNHGNSGGPLLNAQGQVVGINSQISTGDTGQQGNVGIGFAIPIDTVTNVVSQIIQSGRAQHAFLGISAVAVTPRVAQLFRLPVRHGLLLKSVEPGSAAGKAKLKAGNTQVTVAGESYPLGGDLLYEADGTRLSTLDQLRDVISGKEPGDSLTLHLYRGAKKIDVTVKLGRQPSSPQG